MTEVKVECGCLVVNGGKGRNEEKERLTEGVGRKSGRELKDEERDGMLPCLWMGGEKKRKRIDPNLLPDTARAGQNCRDGWYSCCFSGPVGERAGTTTARNHA